MVIFLKLLEMPWSVAELCWAPRLPPDDDMPQPSRDCSVLQHAPCGRIEWRLGEVVKSNAKSQVWWIHHIYIIIYICLIFNMVYFYFMVKVWWPNMCWSCDWIWIWLNTIQYHQISGSKCVWHPKFPGRSPKEGPLPLANLFNRDHPKDGGQIHFKWF